MDARTAPKAGRPIGLIAGSGRLPFLFASAAREQGLRVVAVAHRGETDPSLEGEVESLTWVRLGQVDRMVRALKEAGADRAVMAGGIRRARAIAEARPDLGALRILSKLRSLRDDGLLRAVAAHFEESGIAIVAPTAFLARALAPEGLLAGPPLTKAQRADVSLGAEVARALGRADVGQTVVLRAGHVLALEAVEGTDETIRRGGRLGGAGSVVVKVSKPGQDGRFDLPAVGPSTLEVMREAGARVLAVEAGTTILLDGEALIEGASRLGISLFGLHGRPEVPQEGRLR
ncbi:MAG: UDP-2,3-diacylglucosamine diphosphatase LpxI [Myxococcales bacterium]|nr:UDP-2,3-diacylglucosamine diphosphatase LpxI [Myxococcales bacterium]